MLLHKQDWKELEDIYPRLNEPQNSGASRKDGEFLKRGKGLLTTDIQARTFAPTWGLRAEAGGKGVKYKEGDDVSNRAKEFLLERLIYTHTTYPIGNSENVIKEATELLKTFQK